jgi:Mor family transcriptional regulator
VRISALDLNNVFVAVKCRRAICKNAITYEISTIPINKKNSINKEPKVVTKLTRGYKIFTNAEKEELIMKYKNGVSMTELAKEYGCHHTTVGRLLRKHRAE